MVIIVFKFDRQSLHNAGHIILTGEGVDYGEKNTTQYFVVFPAGAICSSVNISINDDEISEKDEEFTITIMKDSLQFDTKLGRNITSNVLIEDNDSEFYLYMCLMYTFYQNGTKIICFVELGSTNGYYKLTMNKHYTIFTSLHIYMYLKYCRQCSM